MSGIPGPEEIGSIRNLSLRAKLIVEGMIAGLHKSPFHGFSSEFLEYRPYLTGEPAKKIDWRKFARTEKAVVRLFEDETNLRAHILIDKSGSMGFHSSRIKKFEYAKTLAACIAWIFIRQKDAVGIAAFDENISTYLPPGSTNIQLKNILSNLESFNSGATTRCGRAIDQLAVSLKKRGMCIIISDLLDDSSEIIRGLKHLRFKGQDTIVICVTDPMEKEFKSDSVRRIKDMETGREITLDPAVAARFFRQGISSHFSQITEAAREMRVDMEFVSTSEPFQKALLRVMEKRRCLY
ncbi:protein containing von Willebrand factor domain [Chitinispirillum alkaliphilum]|nr:protein containing von Willebrand factor domain [Chitinispirillum alkaliphilum]